MWKWTHKFRWMHWVIVFAQLLHCTTAHGIERSLEGGVLSICFSNAGSSDVLATVVIESEAAAGGQTLPRHDSECVEHTVLAPPASNLEPLFLVSAFVAHRGWPTSVAPPKPTDAAIRPWPHAPPADLG